MIQTELNQFPLYFYMFASILDIESVACLSGKPVWLFALSEVSPDKLLQQS